MQAEKLAGWQEGIVTQEEADRVAELWRKCGYRVSISAHWSAFLHQMRYRLTLWK
jgi:hypothetical protein